MVTFPRHEDDEEAPAENEWQKLVAEDEADWERQILAPPKKKKRPEKVAPAAVRPPWAIPSSGGDVLELLRMGWHELQDWERMILKRLCFTAKNWGPTTSFIFVFFELLRPTTLYEGITRGALQ